MRWRWTLHPTSGFAPCEDAPDAVAGGGGADLSGAGDDSQSSDADAAVEQDSAAEGGADVEDDREETLDRLLVDDEDDDQTRSIEDRFKAITKKNRKLKRQLAKKAGVLQRLEGLDLEDLIASKRKLQEFNEQLSRNPRMRALLSGEAEPAETRHTPPAAATEEEFDEASLPFDPHANATNRYFADMARKNHALEKQVRQLMQRQDTFEGTDRARTEAQVRASWQSTAIAAAAHIQDEGVRDLFKDAVAAAFMDPTVRKQYTPQQVVGHYLRKLKVDPTQAAKANTAAAKTVPPKPVAPARTTTATQARIAEANKSLPRTVAATGSPAPARSDKPSLRDLRTRLGAVGRSA